MILIPIAVLTNRRPLMSFCFFVGPLGALMALVMPGTGFDGYSILLPRMLGYYGTHFMVITAGFALADRKKILWPDATGSFFILPSPAQYPSDFSPRTCTWPL